MPSPPHTLPPGPGPDDYVQLRKKGFYYVDKSHLITEWLLSTHEVLLAPRPRRFGKTLNLSLLRYWLERTDEDRDALFEGLSVNAAPPEVTRHRGQYPVIFLSLKDVKEADPAGAFSKIRQLISQLYREHEALLQSPALDASDRERFHAARRGDITDAGLGFALRQLSDWLHAAHQRDVVILIDEYDAPIESGYQHGYYDLIVGFLRTLLGAALKTNPHLFRAMLTGVRRVSKESLFSDLNNVMVSSMWDAAYSTCFGFTEPEVVELLRVSGRSDQLDAVRAWYNGYLFGPTVIYNPWSVLSFASLGEFRDYWVQTSSDALLRRLLLRSGDGLSGDFETLMAGGEVTKPVDEQVALRDVHREPDSVWAVLLTAGYLKATAVHYDEGEAVAVLRIPNREVAHVWRRSFKRWLQEATGSDANVRMLHQALLAGQARDVARLLAPMVQNTLSYHDTGMGPDQRPERVYQAFVLGLLVTLEPAYRVRSNRESGLGRADVLIVPAQSGKPGVVLEFKRIWTDEGETPEQALDDATAQIRDRGYQAELLAAGASPVHALAVAFDGKKVWVR